MNTWLAEERVGLAAGIGVLLGYALVFLEPERLGPHPFLLASLASAVLGWRLGLRVALVLGLLGLLLQAWWLGLRLPAWGKEPLESVYFLAGGLFPWLAGLIRYRFVRKVKPPAEPLAMEERHTELTLFSRVGDELARDLEPLGLVRGVVDTLCQHPRFEGVAAYSPEGGGLRLLWAGGRPVLPDRFDASHEAVLQAARSARKRVVPLGEDRLLVVVPLPVQGRVEAVLLAVGPAAEISPRDLRFLEGVAAQLSLAIDRSRAYEALHEQETLYRTLLETLPDGVALLDGSRLLYLNPAGLRGLGYAQLEEVVGRPLADFVHPEDLPRVAERLQRILAGEPDQAEEVRLVAADGRVLEVEVHGVLVQLRDQKQVMISIRDVGERKRQQARIEYLAYHDPLTGLPNRRKLWEEAEKMLLPDRRRRDTPALIYLDLDNFKLVNDTLGHPAGDELLCQLAQRIREVLRQNDLLVRMGGDELAVLLPSANREAALAAAQRISRVFQQPFKLGGQVVYAQASLGVALYPEHGQTLDELARAADVAMYQAKQSRTGIAVYDPALDVNSLERLKTIQELRRSIQEGQFLIWYQPILALPEQRVVRWEALVRWEHPVRGLLSPMEFVPLAEESGLVGELDLVVLRQAVREQKRLNRGLAVNFSASTLAHPHWVREVVRALVEENLPPEFLWIEITESALLPERQRWLAGLVALRGLGVRVALDDFGMGYSSLAHLRQLPVDLVKIDKSFVKGVGRDSAAENILKATLQLAQAFGLKTLAEGVERREQLEWLAHHGCNYAQGHYIGPPLSLQEALSRGRAL
ncbi:bifunctional diguanylate cyclase/phosphodiesterase [Meiothermus sp. QL-1]|uniref:putative bifunctional diguanylate cyclase/phosphodiesterase n=1 Tax=Meiothermus sp. QL-1 TaxID=2058095 RepID=UPI001F2FD083|nr:EAL domain-containing protein [Meiothermus sp. QL-1]